MDSWRPFPIGSKAKIEERELRQPSLARAFSLNSHGSIHGSCLVAVLPGDLLGPRHHGPLSPCRTPSRLCRVQLCHSPQESLLDLEGEDSVSFISCNNMWDQGSVLTPIRAVIMSVSHLVFCFVNRLKRINNISSNVRGPAGKSQMAKTEHYSLISSGW